MTARRMGGIALGAAAVAATLVLALPFFWMIATAFKSPAELTAYPPAWAPETLRWGNFAEAWNAAPFGRYYLNSIAAAVISVGLTLAVTAAMAYAFAYLAFPGKNVLFLALVATMLIPEEMKLIPNFLLAARLGWIDTYWGLAVPPAANAFPLFVFHQYFRTLPRDVLDAARIDGAGHGRILFRVVLPMAAPMVAAVGLVTFLGRWNDYLWPLVVIQSPTMRTLPLGLAAFREMGEGSARWDLLMAGTTLAVVPLLLAYALAQRRFVEGLTQGALKG